MPKKDDSEESSQSLGKLIPFIAAFTLPTKFDSLKLTVNNETKLRKAFERLAELPANGPDGGPRPPNAK